MHGSPVVAKAAAAAYDLTVAQRLWALSARLTSVDHGRLA